MNQPQQSDEAQGSGIYVLLAVSPLDSRDTSYDLLSCVRVFYPISVDQPQTVFGKLGSVLEPPRECNG